MNRETIIGSNKTIRDYKTKANKKKIKRKYFIILPNERMYWDFLCMVAIIIVIFLLPFDIAFNLQSDFLNDFNYFTVALFSLDMLINFNTAFIDKGEIIDDRKIIAKDYFKLWFWIDLGINLHELQYPRSQSISLWNLKHKLMKANKHNHRAQMFNC